MRYREFEPCRALRPWVRCYWTKSGFVRPGERCVQRILPDGCADIIVELGDAPAGGPRERTYAVGTMTRPLLVEDSGRLDYVGVRFRPGRAPAFLGIALDEITDDRADLVDLWGPGASRGEERVASAAGTRARVAALEAMLLGRLRDDDRIEPSRLVDDVVRRLQASGGGASVTGMAHRRGVSRQHLTRVFRRHVGVPPKLFARVVRFRAALRQAGSRPWAGWARIAHESGYYDQSHLIADFRELAGLPPTEAVDRR